MAASRCQGDILRVYYVATSLEESTYIFCLVIVVKSGTTIVLLSQHKTIDVLNFVPATKHISECKAEVIPASSSISASRVAAAVKFIVFLHLENEVLLMFPSSKKYKC